MTSQSDARIELETLQAGLEGAVETSITLNGELGDMEKHVSKLTRQIDRGLKSAIEGLAFEGQTLSTVLRDLGQSIVRSTFNVGISPITKHLGGLISSQIEGFIHGQAFANGGVFNQGRVTAFAKGGVVNGPTTFPMRGGTGLMGEAGPEAIMPLARGADGRLGVRAAGGAGVNVTINISTPDVEGFRKSRSQIAAEMSRVIGRAQRNR